MFSWLQFIDAARRQIHHPTDFTLAIGSPVCYPTFSSTRYTLGAICSGPINLEIHMSLGCSGKPGGNLRGHRENVQTVSTWGQDRTHVSGPVRQLHYPLCHCAADYLIAPVGSVQIPTKHWSHFRKHLRGDSWVGYWIWNIQSNLEDI